MMKNIILIFSVIAIFVNTGYTQNLSNEEEKLYNLIMDYRLENNLPKIPLSKSLTFVAQTHAKDLQENEIYQEKCNPHSWSDKGDWTACCYTDDHRNARCMWDKPRELTSYSGDGFEIVFWSSTNVTASEALESWKESIGHNAVIINQDIWEQQSWQAIGIGILGNYAVVWFGLVTDFE